MSSLDRDASVERLRKNARQRIRVGVATLLCLALLAAVSWPVVVRHQSLTVRATLGIGALLIGGLVAAWVTKRLPHTLLLILSSAVTLGLAEIALHFIPGSHLYGLDGHPFQGLRFDPRLGWRFVPNAADYQASPFEYCIKVRINSAGFRGQEPSSRMAGQHLIAVMGDSFTTNLGVQETQVFTSLLAKRLSPVWTVGNFGVNGYGQVQELLLMPEVLATYHPEIVIVMVYAQNDFDDNVGKFDWVAGYGRPFGRLADGDVQLVSNLVEPPSKKRSFSLHDLLARTCLHNALRLALNRRDMSNLPADRQPPELRYCKRAMDATDTGAVRVTEALLRKIARTCADHGARCAFVIAPSLWQADAKQFERLLAKFELTPAEYERRRPQNALGEFFTGQGYPWFDLLPGLEASTPHGEPLYYELEQHWTARGNQVVADEIGRWLGATGFLDPPLQASPIK